MKSPLEFWRGPVLSVLMALFLLSGPGSWQIGHAKSVKKEATVKTAPVEKKAPPKQEAKPAVVQPSKAEAEAKAKAEAEAKAKAEAGAKAKAEAEVAAKKAADEKAAKDKAAAEAKKKADAEATAKKAADEKAAKDKAAAEAKKKADDAAATKKIRDMVKEKVVGMGNKWLEQLKASGGGPGRGGLDYNECELKCAIDLFSANPVDVYIADCVITYCSLYPHMCSPTVPESLFRDCESTYIDVMEAAFQEVCVGINCPDEDPDESTTGGGGSGGAAETHHEVTLPDPFASTCHNDAIPDRVPSSIPPSCGNAGYDFVDGLSSSQISAGCLNGVGAVTGAAAGCNLNCNQLCECEILEDDTTNCPPADCFIKCSNCETSCETSYITRCIPYLQGLQECREGRREEERERRRDQAQPLMERLNGLEALAESLKRLTIGMVSGGKPPVQYRHTAKIPEMSGTASDYLGHVLEGDTHFQTYKGDVLSRYADGDYAESPGALDEFVGVFYDMERALVMEIGRNTCWALMARFGDFITESEKMVDRIVEAPELPPNAVVPGRAQPQPPLQKQAREALRAARGKRLEVASCDYSYWDGHDINGDFLQPMADDLSLFLSALSELIEVYQLKVEAETTWAALLPVETGSGRQVFLDALQTIQREMEDIKNSAGLVIGQSANLPAASPPNITALSESLLNLKGSFLRAGVLANASFKNTESALAWGPPLPKELADQFDLVLTDEPGGWDCETPNRELDSTPSDDARRILDQISSLCPFFSRTAYAKEVKPDPVKTGFLAQYREDLIELATLAEPKLVELAKSFGAQEPFSSFANAQDVLVQRSLLAVEHFIGYFTHQGPFYIKEVEDKRTDTARTLTLGYYRPGEYFINVTKAGFQHIPQDPVVLQKEISPHLTDQGHQDKVVVSVATVIVHEFGHLDYYFRSQGELTLADHVASEIEARAIAAHFSLATSSPVELGSIEHVLANSILEGGSLYKIIETGVLSMSLFVKEKYEAYQSLKPFFEDIDYDANPEKLREKTFQLFGEGGLTAPDLPWILNAYLQDEPDRGRGEPKGDVPTILTPPWATP